MRILKSAEELSALRGRICIALGFFDGVHLGHQQIIRQTISDARQHEATSLIITFDRHPNTVVAPERVPPLIYSLPQKLRAILALGPDATWVIHFDEPFSRQSGEEFVRRLASRLAHIQSICVGANFVFGHKRGGNVELLRTLGRELHFAVHGMAAVSLDGEVVSSTRIRQCIAMGELDSASQMLGRAYSIAGKVIAGDHLGRRLGFPTANIDVSGLALPPKGVYAVHAAVAGREYRAVLNIGCRPTLGRQKAELRVEAHLLDFAGEVYGEEAEFIFVERLRDEKKFAGLDELKKQIELDIAEAVKKF